LSGNSGLGEKALDEPYKIQIHDMPEEERPREKLKKYGPASLKNYELIRICHDLS
jgi:hypothetical protein